MLIVILWVVGQATTNGVSTASAALLTVIYLVGLVLRPQRRVLRNGPDSSAVLVLYALGVVGLVALQ